MAIGLALIFGVRGVINLAHGELFILGSYTVLALFGPTGTVWWGVLAAPFAVGAIGWGLERSMIRHLYRRPLDTLVATWGLGIIIRELLKLVFGAGHRNLPLPLTGNVSVFGVLYPQYRVFLILISLVTMAVVLWAFLATEFGMRVRAVVHDREMAEAMGIDAGRVDQALFAVGAGLAGFAGAVMTPLLTLNPEVGLIFLARSFLVVIIGGVGSLFGTVTGAAVIGGGEALISFFMRPVLAQSLLFLVAILIIRLRPAGLLGTRR